MHRVPDQVTQRGDRSFAARIAQPSEGANGRRPRIVGIGHGQFGGDQDRLAGGDAEVVGGLREPFVHAVGQGEDSGRLGHFAGVERGSLPVAEASQGRSLYPSG